MKITRWSAELKPNYQIISQLFTSEGLEPKEYKISSGAIYSHQKTHLTEIIHIVSGELIFNLSGTQFVLREGDKLEIPSNTTYAFNNMKENECIFLSAQKI